FPAFRSKRRQASPPNRNRKHSQWVGREDSVRTRARSRSWRALGVLTLSHFCPEAFGRRKRAAESREPVSACSGDGRILRLSQSKEGLAALDSLCYPLSGQLTGSR